MTYTRRAPSTPKLVSLGTTSPSPSEAVTRPRSTVSAVIFPEQKSP